MSTETPALRGRPSVPAKRGMKTTLSLRVTPAMKDSLQEAAALAGRNLSQEAEVRLWRSFRDDEIIPRLDLILKAVQGRPPTLKRRT